MTIDIIVCTYNRPFKVNELVNQFVPLRDFFSLPNICSNDDCRMLCSVFDVMEKLPSSLSFLTQC